MPVRRDTRPQCQGRDCKDGGENRIQSRGCQSQRRVNALRWCRLPSSLSGTRKVWCRGCMRDALVTLVRSRNRRRPCPSSPVRVRKNTSRGKKWSAGAESPRNNRLSLNCVPCEMEFCIERPRCQNLSPTSSTAAAYFGSARSTSSSPANAAQVHLFPISNQTFASVEHGFSPARNREVLEKRVSVRRRLRRFAAHERPLLDSVTSHDEGESDTRT